MWQKDLGFNLVWITTIFFFLFYYYILLIVYKDYIDFLLSQG